MPGGDELLEDRGRRVQPVAALLVHRVEDLVGGVEADEVEQRERAHGVATAEAHRRVEVLARGVAALLVAAGRQRAVAPVVGCQLRSRQRAVGDGRTVQVGRAHGQNLAPASFIVLITQRLKTIIATLNVGLEIADDHTTNSR